MRFRHKLSIVLVMLVLVPLLAAGLLVGGLLANNERAAVDDDLSASLAGASAVYRSRLDSAGALAASIASRSRCPAGAARRRCRQAAPERDRRGQDRGAPAAARSRRLATGPVWRTEAQVGKGSEAIGRVVVTIPLDAKLLHDIADSTPRAKGVGLALIVDGAAVATDRRGYGRGVGAGVRSRHGCHGRPGQGVRAQSLRVSPAGHAPQGGARPAPTRSTSCRSGSTRCSCRCCWRCCCWARC